MSNTARNAVNNWLSLVDLRRSVRASLRQRGPSPAAVTAGSQLTRSSVMALFPVRIFLAAGWIRAGVEKSIDRTWWTGEKLESFLSGHRQNSLHFFLPVIDHVIAPMSIAVAFIVMATEIAIGVAIGVGRPLRLALRWGVVLNVAFVLSGEVNPSAFYLVMQLLLLLAIADGTIGVNQSTPSRRSFAVAGVTLGFTAVLVPYIRTIEPARVITDPAMMLAFVNILLSGTVMLRWLAANPAALRPGLGAAIAPVLFRWVQAKPCDVLSTLSPIGSGVVVALAELSTQPHCAQPVPEAPPEPLRISPPCEPPMYTPFPSLDGSAEPLHAAVA